MACGQCPVSGRGKGSEDGPDMACSSPESEKGIGWEYKRIKYPEGQPGYGGLDEAAGGMGGEEKSHRGVTGCGCSASGTSGPDSRRCFWLVS